MAHVQGKVNMNKGNILKKFGRENYKLANDTYVMGIHQILGTHIAQRFADCDIILEACTGAGFMLIPLAQNVKKVITVEINSEHLKQAKNNIKIAGVNSKIRFILGNILEDKVMKKIPKIDAAFLDPDWAEAGKSKSAHATKLSSMQPPADILLNKTIKKTPNVALRLPKELNLRELRKVPPHELEKIYLDNDFKFYCAYFGKLARKIGRTRFEAFTL
ncbi:MAG: methyltransferase domain-containing protein [Candidatus Micrarchaeaceae archaeon]|jgi:tRNA1(Val) A37 N6-methylase TrmN6